MKKIFTIMFFTAATIQFASAQSFKQKDYHQDRNQVQNNSGRFDDHHQQSDYAYKNNGRNDDRDRQVAYDRMNQQYDQRIADCNNDRSLSRYERDRRIRGIEQERQQQSRSFGKGLVIAGAATILLGALFSHH